MNKVHVHVQYSLNDYVRAIVAIDLPIRDPRESLPLPVTVQIICSTERSLHQQKPSASGWHLWWGFHIWSVLLQVWRFLLLLNSPQPCIACCYPCHAIKWVIIWENNGCRIVASRNGAFLISGAALRRWHTNIQYDPFLCVLVPMVSCKFSTCTHICILVPQHAQIVGHVCCCVAFWSMCVCVKDYPKDTCKIWVYFSQ